jgi:hypothetical protein
MRSHRSRWFVAVAAAFVVAGCAGVPDAGPVKVGRPIAAAGGGLADATVREVPAGPLPGASPVQLVSGFLRAMVDSDGGYGVARSYLVPGTTWSADSGIAVYAEPTRVVRTARDTVVVHASRVGVLGPRGVYRVDPGRITRRFAVARRAGDWRISKLAAGALISSDDAGRVLQPAALYFLTPDGTRVVPEPVLESPHEPGLATTLMRALIAGPNPMLAPGVRTAVPRGTALVGNVPITADGVADVDLSVGTRQLTAQQLARLSAQVVWTLRQLSSVTAVRLLANGTPLEAPGVSSLQLVSSWPEFDPDASSSTRGALVVVGGRVSGLGGSVPAVLRGTRAVAANRSSDGLVAAAVRAGASGRRLLVGKVADGHLRERLRDVSITSPAFGPRDEAIAATSSGAVYAVPATGAKRRIALAPALRGAAIRALAVSRDGTRVALVLGAVAGNEVVLATVVRGGGRLAFRSPRVVVPASYDVSGLAWVDADELVTTVSVPGGGRGVVRVGTNGYQMHALSEVGLPSDVVAVAAAPRSRILASGRAGTWQLVGQRWHKVSSGRAPTYAGG